MAGMHRSGTSPVTRLLMLLGASGPRHPMPARKGNQSGHWEPLPIVELNDEMLASASMSWDDVGPFPLDWLDGPAGERFRRRAVELVESEYDKSPLFVLKDPRICRMIPFWRSVLSEVGADSSFVLPVRNPLEVAASLKRRDGLPAPHGLLLWLRHVLDAEAATRTLPRAFVSYEILLRDWEAVSRLISERLGIAWPGSSHAARHEIERVISAEGRHHSFDAGELESRPEVVGWVKRAYSALAEAAGSGEDPDARSLGAIRSLLEDADAAYGPVVAESASESRRLAGEATVLNERLAVKEDALRERSRQVEKLAVELRAREQESEHLGQQLAEIEALRAQLAEQSAGLAEELHSKDEALAHRTGDLERVAEELGVRQAEAERAHRQLAETESELARLSEETKVLNERLRGKDEALAHRTGELEQLAQALASAQDERREAIAHLGEEIQRMSAELAAHRGGWPKRVVRRLGASRRSGSQLLSWALFPPSRHGLRRVRTYLALRRSGEFDAAFYRSAYPDVASSTQNPLMHYVEHGAREGRDPSRAFTTEGYLACHPEATHSGVNPLLHWLRSGKRPFSDPPSSGPRDRGNGAGSHRPLRHRAAKAGKGYRAFVAGTIPDGGVAVVASNGQTGLLALPGLKTRRFPQHEANGASAPPGSMAAVAQLEWLRAQGAEYLVLPQETREWWGSLREFHSYVGRHYPWAAISEQGLIARLEAELNGARSWQTRLDTMLEEYSSRFRHLPSILDLTDELDVATSFPELTVISPLEDDDSLAYVDGSVDLVIVGDTADRARLREGRRVARKALITLSQRADDQRAIEWLSDPERRLPTISIVVPSFDGADHLRVCLRAISSSLPPHIEAEVLVVDDCSADETPELLSSWSQRDQRIRHIRSERNLGFLDSCNLAASRAEGQVLVFLNNDTVPVSGWLQPLVETLADRADAGAVGGMLLYPNGVLQEAGGVIFSDGQAANFGRGDSPDRPLYRFVRSVDYCSGALLATERDVFSELGGFDTLYRPGYYEDADYCFRLRGAGLKTYYQPGSVVIHVEGGTAGTDVEQGPKRHQVTNRERFRERWAQELPKQSPPQDGFDEAVWMRLARRRLREPTAEA